MKKRQMKGMRDMEKIERISALFEANKDAQQASSMSRYMRDQFPFYGIPAPLRRKLYRPFLREEKKDRQIDWAFLDACMAAECREFQYLVYDYLLTLNDFVIFADMPKLKRYAQTKPWWDTIDFLDQVIGNLSLRDERAKAVMREWAHADDIWLRRIAIDHQLGHKEKTDTALLEEIIASNLGSDEFFINKAIGWSLRDYARHDPDWVRAFLRRYSGQMSALSIREASRHLKEDT